MLKQVITFAAVAGLVFALPPAVQAQPVEGNWDDDSGDHLWSTGVNWWPDLPDGNLPPTPHLVSAALPNPSDSFMDVDTSALGIGNVNVKDFIHLTVQNYLKASGSIYVTTSAIFTVVSGGTVEGDIRVVSNPGVGSEIIFSGGACAGGRWQTPDDRQEVIYRVDGSTSGTIAPTAFVNDSQNGGYTSVPLVNFILDAGGVTPIQPSGADPVQIGGGSPLTPYDLTIDGLSTYTGPLGDIPLITFTGGTDPDRMFGNITIDLAGVPVAWNPTVLQTDSGVTLNLVPEPATMALLGLGGLGLLRRRRRG